SASASTPTNNTNSALPSPVGDRRRQGLSRARRYLASRQSALDSFQNVRDHPVMADFADAMLHRRPGQAANHGPPDEASLRQLQLARGAISSKMIASRTAIQTLQSVDVNQLSGNERTCIICYNDYGVESPEGSVESPVRLPKCKHVFGNICIKKWLEDSDNCPYCRDKLPSEPKTAQSVSGRAFMNLMRLRGITSLQEHVYAHLLSGATPDELLDALTRQSRGAERRSPPDDATGEDHRRTRQRRSSPAPTAAANRAAASDHRSAAHDDDLLARALRREHVSLADAQLLHSGAPRSVAALYGRDNNGLSPASARDSQSVPPPWFSPMNVQHQDQRDVPDGAGTTRASSQSGLRGFPNSSAVPAGALHGPRSQGGGHAFRQAGLYIVHGSADQGSMPSSPYVIERQLPNPLQGHSRLDDVAGYDGNVPSLRGSVPGQGAQQSTSDGSRRWPSAL
ncbi:hypothetical protein CP532_6299, partial [Ophiocordyceps camponoti-leonardi (nom. inval.)]